MQTPESVLFEIAENQQGYFTFQQAIAAGSDLIKLSSRAFSF